MKADILRIYKAIVANKNNSNFTLPKDEQKKIFEYFYNNLFSLNDQEKEMLNYIISFIINNKHIGIIGRQLLYQVICNEKCAKKKVSPIRVFYQKLNNQMVKYNNQEISIYLDEKLLTYPLNGLDLGKEFKDIYPLLENTSNIIIIAFIINHSIEHYYQNMMQRRNKECKAAIAYLKNLFWGTDNSDNGFCNYENKLMEDAANISGFNDTLEFLARHKYKNKSDNTSLLQTWQNTSKWIQFNSDLSSDEWEVEKLINYIKEKPSLVNTYPQLGLFFNKDGSIKPLEVLVDEYNTIRVNSRNIEAHEKEEIYRKFILHLLMLQNYQIETNDSNKYCRIIHNLIRDDLTSIQIFIKDIKEEDISSILTIKTNRVLKLLELLKSLDNSDSYLRNIEFNIKEFLTTYENYALLYPNLSLNICLNKNIGILRDNYIGENESLKLVDKLGNDSN